MRLIPILLAAAAGLCAAAPAPAAETLNLPHFRTIELRGGGRIVLRHGAGQSVTIQQGSSAYTTLRVERRRGDERLTVDACNNRCPQHYDLTIEVVTPDIEAVSIQGGGSIVAESGFGRTSAIAAAVSGGGRIDLRAMPVRDVAAAVDGGGSLLVNAEQSLAAAVNGGGSIRYWGKPDVTTSINGGGSVRAGE
jgi:hypothetical protein